jgi:hypothetical protein
MRWVLITPFGCPVEPEVNRIFATVSARTAACAASTAAVGRASSNSAKCVARGPGGGFVVTTTSTEAGTAAAMARANATPFVAKTRPGVRISMIAVSFLKSCDISE